MKNEKVMIGQTKNGEIEKETTHIIVEIIEYIPNAVVSRTIIKKNSGNITAMSFDEGEELGEKQFLLIHTYKLYMGQHN